MYVDVYRRPALFTIMICKGLDIICYDYNLAFSLPDVENHVPAEVKELAGCRVQDFESRFEVRHVRQKMQVRSKEFSTLLVNTDS